MSVKIVAAEGDVIVDKNTVEGKGKKSLWLKILILALIIIAIAGIYVIKNNEQAGNDLSDAVLALDATEDFDLDEILSYGLPVMIDFGSDSCIPCKQMAPVLEELNKELQGKAVVKFVDVWENDNVASEIPLRVIPTQFFFDADGKPYVPADEENDFIHYIDEETEEYIFTAHEGKMEKDDILAVFKELGVQ